MNAGSYTVIVDYIAETEQKCNIYLDDKTKTCLHGNEFYLSRNKQSVEYDFWLTSAVDDLHIVADSYNGEGAFDIKAIQVMETNRNYRLLLFSWVILNAIILIYKLIIKRFNKQNAILILGIAFLPSIILFMPGLGVNQDYAFHFQRIESIADSIIRSEFPSKIYTTFNDGYGYAAGVYYGDLLLYIPAILRVIGFSIISAYKIFVVLTNLATSVICYFCVKEIIKNEKIALAATLVYVVNSYRLMDIYVRYAVGEYTALIFYPLIALALWKIYSKSNEDYSWKHNALTLGVGMTGLLYTHIVSTEMVIFVVAVTAIICFKKTFTWTVIKTYAMAVGVCILLGVGFIVPFIDYYVNSNTQINSADNTVHLIQTQSAHITDLFAVFKNYYGKSGPDVTEHMLFTPGVVMMLVVLAGLYLMVTKKCNKEIKLFTIASVAVLLFSTSAFPWNFAASHVKIINLLAVVQYSWRFIGIATMLITILFGLIANQLQGELMVGKLLIPMTTLVCICMSFAFVSFSIANAKQEYFVDTEELPFYTYYYHFDTDGLGAMEYLPNGLSTENIEELDYSLIAEHGTAGFIEEYGLKYTFSIDTNESTYVDVPRFSYPYYYAEDDSGNQLKITTGENGKLRVIIPGEYSGLVFISFKEPIYWRISEIISLLSLLAGIIYAFCKLVLCTKKLNREEHHYDEVK